MFKGRVKMYAELLERQRILSEELQALRASLQGLQAQVTTNTYGVGRVPELEMRLSQIKDSVDRLTRPL